MEQKLSHIAIIMDGNQRWSKLNKKTLYAGYLEGLNNLEIIIDECIKHNIKYVTIFALSTENIKRKSSYIIFNLIKDLHKKFFSTYNKKKINVKIIGEKENIPKNILKIFDKIKNLEKSVIQLNIAFNYGSLYEIKNVIKKILDKKIDNIQIDDIKNNMYLANIPDPEILIRTGGFQRLSNFMMFNLSYTELFFTKTLWPDFSIKELNRIISKFKKIKRNNGL